MGVVLENMPSEGPFVGDMDSVWNGACTTWLRGSGGFGWVGDCSSFEQVNVLMVVPMVRAPA